MLLGSVNNIKFTKEKIQALSLAKECYSMKLDLLTNATVVDDAIRCVYQKTKDNAESKDSSNEDDKESNESDYGEDEVQLEEVQGEEAGEITTNEVF